MPFAGSIAIWAGIFTVGVAIQTVTVNSIPQISTGRFIAGLGVGAMSAIVPLYNGESSPKALRGTLLVVYQVQIISGYFRFFNLFGTSLNSFTAYSYRMSLILVHTVSRALRLGVYLLGCK